jgi:site-specific recombinase XerD
MTERKKRSPAKNWNGVYFRPSRRGPAVYGKQRGYWCISYTVADSRGVKQHLRVRTSFESRDGARTARDARLGSAALGRFELPNERGHAIGLHALTDDYLEYLKIKNRSWKLYVTYLARIKSHFGDVAADRVSFADCQAFKTETIKQFQQRAWAAGAATTFSPATANRYLAALKGMFRWAEEMEKIETSPARRVRLERETTRPHYYLTEGEKMMLVEVAGRSRHEYLKPAILLALYTGMRKDEILGLTWDRVDFENRFVTLTRTKNGQMRHVPLNAPAESVLRDLQSRGGDGIHLFPGRLGRLMDVRKAWDEVREEVAKSVPKFKRCRFHDLRHTYASDLVVAGKSLEAVGRILGHTESSAPTTTRRYVHLRPEHLLEAAGAVKAVTPPLHELASVAPPLHSHHNADPKRECASI